MLLNKIIITGHGERMDVFKSHQTHHGININCLWLVVCFLRKVEDSEIVLLK